MSIERVRDGDVLLTFQEAADLLRISRATMYRLLASGQLVGHKVGRGWRFYKAEIHHFVVSQNGMRMRSAEQPAASTAGEATPRD